jgi:hypothetical protein
MSQAQLSGVVHSDLELVDSNRLKLLNVQSGTDPK